MEQEVIIDLEREGQILDEIQSFLDELTQCETVTFLNDAILDDIVDYLKELVSKLMLLLELL